jgi:hypothetical protein
MNVTKWNDFVEFLSLLSDSLPILPKQNLERAWLVHIFEAAPLVSREYRRQ